jgi:hypothetical protein
MANNRLISTFTLTTANRRLVGSYDGGAATNIDVAAGTYRWSCNAAAYDFAAALDAALVAAFGGTWTVQVEGVDASDASIANGRPKIICANGHTFSLLLSHVNMTMDPGIVGGGSAPYAATGVNLIMPYVHRYGWYPQTDAEEDLPDVVVRTNHVYYSDFTRSGTDWGEYGDIRLAWRARPSYLVRMAAATDGSRDPTVAYLTLGDPSCTMARFVADLARNVASVVLLPRYHVRGDRAWAVCAARGQSLLRATDRPVLDRTTCG